jgi:hypothetical protein
MLIWIRIQLLVKYWYLVSTAKSGYQPVTGQNLKVRLLCMTTTRIRIWTSTQTRSLTFTLRKLVLVHVLVHEVVLELLLELVHKLVHELELILSHVLVFMLVHVPTHVLVLLPMPVIVLVVKYKKSWNDPLHFSISWIRISILIRIEIFDRIWIHISSVVERKLFFPAPVFIKFRLRLQLKPYLYLLYFLFNIYLFYISFILYSLYN